VHWEYFQHFVVTDECFGPRDSFSYYCVDGALYRGKTFGRPSTVDCETCADAANACSDDCCDNPSLYVNPSTPCWCETSCANYHRGPGDEYECGEEPTRRMMEEEVAVDAGSRRGLRMKPPPGGSPPPPPLIDVDPRRCQEYAHRRKDGLPAKMGCRLFMGTERYCEDAETVTCDDFDSSTGYVVVTSYPQGYSGPADVDVRVLDVEEKFVVLEDPLVDPLGDPTSLCCPTTLPATLVGAAHVAPDGNE
jgi:hypothetical protein